MPNGRDDARAETTALTNLTSADLITAVAANT
jgi:hypothetical protein